MTNKPFDIVFNDGDVAKLVDAQARGACEATRAGSTPAVPTNYEAINGY